MPFNKTCCFAKTRAEKKKCSKEHPTQYKCLTEGQLRVSRMPLNSYGCAYHIYAMCQENFCSCPAIWGHSETLVYCPKRLYIVFDEEGRKLLNYKPRTKICLKCQNNADVRFSSHPLYIGPAKRQRVIMMFSLYLTYCIIMSFG